MNIDDIPRRHIRIFLSSPGDVTEERALARKVIQQLQSDPIWRGKISTECIAWDKPGVTTAMLATMTPQEAINKNLATPSQCDIVVVIFWSRMGTPLPEEYKKPDGSPYLSGTEWEFEDAVTASEKKDGIPIVSVYRRSDPPIIAMNDPEFDAKRVQWERVEKFFAAFKNADTSIKRGSNAYTTPDDFQDQLERHLKQFIWKLLAENKQSHWTQAGREVDVWHGSPFPGLRAFTPADFPIFWGRHRETDALIRQLQRTRFVAVIGSSGSGKSSLVNAGLIHHLRSGSIEGSEYWEILRFSPGEMGTNPFRACAKLFSELLKMPSEALQEALFANPLILVEYCQQALVGKSEWAELVFVIDQFEEIFTIVSQEFRSPFIQMIVNATQESKRIRFVTTLRADFYHNCVEWKDLTELLRGGSFPLAPPDQFALHEMIVRPAQRAGLEFDIGLAEQIIRETGDEAGALALMAYVLDELYRDRSESGLITFEAYKKLNGVRGAIGKRAEQCFSELDGEAQASLFDVFRKLITADERGIETRQRALFKELCPQPAMERLVQAFTAARMLVQNGDRIKDEVYVEVAHEALLQNWPRLSNWINDIRDDLRLLRQVTLAAHDWQANERDASLLWADERLKRVNNMLERQKPAIDEILRDFIRPESERLIEKLQHLQTNHLDRNDIGIRLAKINDTRPGVGLRADGLPDIEWQPVSAGTVKLRNGVGIFEVEAFAMARYPITFQQFNSFVLAEDGYFQALWWNGLAQRENQPSNPKFTFNNYPRDMVNWYEAMAFCRWLTARYDLPNSQIIRLPTEWEWQQAATGGKRDYEYAWSELWDKTRANTANSNLGRATAVGMYPHGVSPTGLYDMCGNVWEWCLNDFDMLSVNTQTNDYRVVRGGSWDDEQNIVTTTYRDGQKASNRNSTLGFRACLAAPVS
ncbi:MAG: SUMF1/EgtB/PvdO family nonheme iron enzyme [Anaerolineaceae bacterium]|nr:SUMF1/EgtB/PvdO family nonheme iron enzyme [Anaerolineaceae bacterium]